jgi:hypothetical protein
MKFLCYIYILNFHERGDDRKNIKTRKITMEKFGVVFMFIQ